MIVIVLIYRSPLNDAGYYRMDITLSNGEQYYGYFRVEN